MCSMSVDVIFQCRKPRANLLAQLKQDEAFFMLRVRSYFTVQVDESQHLRRVIAGAPCRGLVAQRCVYIALNGSKEARSVCGLPCSGIGGRGSSLSHFEQEQND